MMSRKQLLRGLLEGLVSPHDVTTKPFLFQFLTLLDGKPVCENLFAMYERGLITNACKVESDEFEGLAAHNSKMFISGLFGFTYQGYLNFQRPEGLQKWQPMFAFYPLCGIEYREGQKYPEIKPSECYPSIIVDEGNYNQEI